MRYLWSMCVVLLLFLVGEALFHPIGALTDDLLLIGMPTLGIFVILNIVIAIQMAVRSHRQLASATTTDLPKPKLPRSYGMSRIGDGGYVPTAVDAGCPSDGGGGAVSC